jgi:hypothetical protein
MLWRQHRDEIVDTGDVSEAESENEAGAEEEVVAEDAAEERLFKLICFEECRI